MLGAESRTERTRQRLTFALEEYRTLRAEYAQHLSYQHQVLTLTFLLAAAILGATPTILSEKSAQSYYWLYAAASVVFQGISWMQLRYLEANVAIRNYLALALAPRVTRLLQNLGPGTADCNVFAWESEGMSLTYRDEFWLIPIIGARLFLSLFAAGLCALAFGLLQPSQLGLIIFLSLSMVYSVGATFGVLKHVKHLPKKLNELQRKQPSNASRR